MGSSIGISKYYIQTRSKIVHLDLAQRFYMPPLSRSKSPCSSLLPGPRIVIVLHEPFDGRVECLIKRRELEPAHKLQKLLVRGRFAELTVSPGGVEAIFALESDGFDDRVRHLFDAHLFVFTHGQDDRFNIVVLPQHPNEQLGEIVGIDELPEGLARTGDDEGCIIFLGQETFVDKPRDDVGVLQIEVIVRPENIRRDC